MFANYKGQPALSPDTESQILDILSRCKDMAIATVRPDGGPQVTTVSFGNEGLLIYVACGADSQNARNLASEHRVSLAATPPYAGWADIQGLSISGSAHEVTEARERSLALRLLSGRNADIAEIDRNNPRAVRVFSVRPTLISIVDYRQGFGHTDITVVGTDDIVESRLRRHGRVPA